MLVGALRYILVAIDKTETGTVTDFLKKATYLLSGPDGIFTKSCASSISDRLHRDMSRNKGHMTANLDYVNLSTVLQWRRNVVPSHMFTAGHTVKRVANPIVGSSENAECDMFLFRYEIMLPSTLRNDRFKPYHSRFVLSNK